MSAQGGGAPPRYRGIERACRMVECYETLNTIGEGTYGVVYRARDRRTRAILRHPNIVQLLEVVAGHQTDHVYLAFEYVEHDVAQLLDTRRPPVFKESEVKCLARQLLSAVRYLHSRWIVHRDLKCSNLLYSNRGELKLADFGLARTCGQPEKPITPTVVTLWYRAPELLLGQRTYGPPIDLWAVGCIVAELMIGEPLLPGKTEPDQFRLVASLLGSPTERIWPDVGQLPLARRMLELTGDHKYNCLRRRIPSLSDSAFHLINSLLTYDPKKRMTAEEALCHHYFEERPLPQPVDMMPTFPIHPSRLGTDAQAAGGGGSSTAAAAEGHYEAARSAYKARQAHGNDDGKREHLRRLAEGLRRRGESSIDETP
eukprot:m51a1_g10735 putative cyclin-dependent kinase g-2-like isoform x1 (371) ;mRNA; r:303012-304824